MAPDRFAEIDEIFRRAIHLDRDARETFVRDAAAGDAAMVRELLDLLDEDDAAGALDRPAIDRAILADWPLANPFGSLDEPGPPELDPLAIPGFRLLRRLGAGGMGVVYEAEQAAPRRIVALKVMRSPTPGAASARRFALEAHVLARLQHPGIAQIFGTGIFDGPTGKCPYLVMELVRGEPLVDGVALRALGVAARLELVATICDAVHHAHQRGVIHRDLKPANILLVSAEESDSTGASPSRGHSDAVRPLRAKILDFGVAKAIGDAGDGETAGTLDGQLVGTLAYMSPEQVASPACEVDIRSDVYALGVIAYELLAGRHPYELRGLSTLESARLIREVNPQRLGLIDRRLAGDVETIVGKAMEKSATLRYQSASELAADIRRHLRLEPIAARPHSALHHLTRLARRHRAVTTMLATTILALGVGAVIVSLALAATVRERDEARRQAAIAAAVNAFVDEDLLGAADAAQENGAFLTVREALDRAALSIDAGHVDDPWVEAALRSTIGRCYRRLGMLDDADRHLTAALVLRRDLDRRPRTAPHPDTIEAINELAKLRTLQGREAEAIEGYREVLESRRVVQGDAHESTILAYGNLAVELRRARRIDESIALQERAHALATAHLDAANPYRVQVAVGLASLYRDLDRLEEAEPIYRDALERSRDLHGPQAQHTLRLMNSLAILQIRRGELAEAESLLLDAIAAAEIRVGRDHPNTLTYRTNLGDLYITRGRLDDAKRVLEESAVAHEALLGPTHRGTLVTMTALARTLALLGDTEAAAALRTEIASRWIDRDGPESPEAAALRDLK